MGTGSMGDGSTRRGVGSASDEGDLARPRPSQSIRSDQDRKARDQLIAAAKIRHTNQAMHEDSEGRLRRRSLSMVTGGLGTIMLMIGTILALNLALPAATPAPEVLAIELSNEANNGIGLIETAAAAVTTSASTPPTTAVEPEQPRGPLPSPTATQPAASQSSSADDTPLIEIPVSDPVSLNSTTTTTTLPSSPTTVPVEIGTPTTLVIPLPPGPPTTQVPTDVVTTTTVP